MEMNRIRKGKGRRKGQAGQEKGQALRPVPGMASAYGVPVLLGGDGSVFLEDLGKAALGRIVQADRDLREGVVRVAEEIGSLPELFPMNVWSRRRAPCSAVLSRFPNASPRTVRAPLNAYGSPSILALAECMRYG